MSPFRLASFVLFVRDMDISKKFYQDLLGQEIAMDLGLNVGFTSGLGLWKKDYAQKVIFGCDQPSGEGNDTEVYFETEKIDEAWEKIRAQGVEVIHEIREQPWCQRVFRVRDPDQFIVEIAEPMDAVVRRLHNEGFSKEEIVKKTLMPQDVITAILESGGVTR